MKATRYHIAAETGIHARPAALLVQTAEICFRYRLLITKVNQ